MICPYCRKLYPDDDVFCPVDGNTLVEEIEQETVDSRKIPFSAPHHGGGQGYDDTIVFRPPVTPSHSQSSPRGSAGNSILMGVLGGCVVLIVVLIYFLASGSPPPDTSQGGNPGSKNTPSPSPSPSPTPTATVENKNPVNTPGSSDPTVPAPDPPKIERPRMPEGVERTFRGTSYVSGNLPLTMSLKRNGSSLNGSAVTPGDEDRLSGTIAPDGSFNLAGYNYKAGRVTGTWRGTISESGEINGTWYATNGTRVRFYAK